MIGQGGRQDDFDTARKSQGGGVIGVGGAMAVPGFAETGSVGVFGQGSDAISRTVSSDGVPGTSGPKDPGAGVIGRGGIQVSDGGTLNGPLTATADPTGAGVIGLGGGVGVPAFAETGNAGVFGKGAVGVKGFSSEGIGVLGTSDSFEGVHGTGARQSARGGVFETSRAAQVRLVPHSDGGQPRLPKDGQPGDLIATTFGAERQQFCQLYFCVARPSGATPAQWAPVQLGASVPGNV
jgi:hypothetical protein